VSYSFVRNIDDAWLSRHCCLKPNISRYRDLLPNGNDNPLFMLLWHLMHCTLGVTGLALQMSQWELGEACWQSTCRKYMLVNSVDVGAHLMCFEGETTGGIRELFGHGHHGSGSR
jgi:hypothetical protein